MGRLGIALAAMLLAGPRARALDPALDVSQYAHTAWKVREGFTKGRIYRIAQTPDGYLWLGTEVGLARFDGVRAVEWHPPSGEHLPDNWIRSLFAARDGTLWIGTLKGLASWKDGKLTLYSKLAGLTVDALLEDEEGTIWVAGYLLPFGKVCSIRRDNIQCYGEEGSLGGWVETLYEDTRKNVWAGASTGLWRLRLGPPKLYPLASRSGSVHNITEDAQGALLICTDSGIKRFANDKIETYPLPSIGPRLTVNTLFRDRDGGLWMRIKGGRGLAHVHQGRTDVFSVPDGLSGDSVANFFEDREGNIWVSTNEGLDRFRNYAVATFSLKEGLSNAIVSSVLAERDGSVWMTTPDGLYQWKNGQIAAVAGQSRKDRMALSVFRDSRGRIWLCTPDQVGYLERGHFISVPGITGPVRVVSEDTGGNLWFSGQNSGLFRLSPRSEIQQIPWAMLGHKDFAMALAADPLQGGIWLGFYNGGIAYFRDGQIRASYRTADGLGEGFVGRFRFDPDGTVWAATEGGLSRLKNGRVATLTSKNGLPCDAVHWVIQDNERSFWLSMPCGLVRIARFEIDAWAVTVDKDKDTKRTIQATIFDSSDGVQLLAFVPTYSPVSRSTDGKLWFVTGSGVSVVDPHHLPFNKLPPPVHIEQITADRKTYDPIFDSIAEATGKLKLPALIRDMEIDYTAPSFVAPEKMRFRYKLEGLDRDWQDVGARRQAFYTNLPPRNFRFRVMACNDSGVWNEAGAFLDFSVAPAYYQTWWFRLSCVVAFLTLLWAVYQLQLRQVTAQVRQRLEGRFEERERIARELHDTLLQSFQGLLLYLQAGVNLLPDLPAVARAREKLEGAIDQAEQAITEGRDAVQGLRSSTIETNDLAAALNALAAELTANQGGQNSPVFCVQVEGASRDLHPILRDDIFRIGGEALRNAFLHAQASRIEVQIHYDERQLRVRIRDDGKGMDSQIVTDKGRPGHWGLRGMQERAKLVGGNLEVWSKPDSGTEIDLTIPASTAYATPTQRRSWLSRKGTAAKS